MKLGIAMAARMPMIATTTGTAMTAATTIKIAGELLEAGATVPPALNRLPQPPQVTIALRPVSSSSFGAPHLLQKIFIDGPAHVRSGAARALARENGDV